MANLNKEYERGFKDGLKSKIGDELLPMTEQILVSVSDAIKSVIPLMVDRMEIKANLDSNDWIPCSERLPEDNSLVLIIGGGHRCIAVYNESKQRFYLDDDYCYVKVSQVTHWLPVPEIPQEE